MSFVDAAVVFLYPILIALAVMVVFPWTRVLPQLTDKQALHRLALGMIVVVTTLLCENIYYGIGRMFPLYMAYLTEAPLALVFKAGYVVGLAFKFWALQTIAPSFIQLTRAVVGFILVWLFFFIFFFQLTPS
jgi:hypothetical protein